MRVTNISVVEIRWILHVELDLFQIVFYYSPILHLSYNLLACRLNLIQTLGNKKNQTFFLSKRNRKFCYDQRGVVRWKSISDVNAPKNSTRTSAFSSAGNVRVGFVRDIEKNDQLTTHSRTRKTYCTSSRWYLTMFKNKKIRENKIT